jgi:hypothetical protein
MGVNEVIESQDRNQKFSLCDNAVIVNCTRMKSNATTVLTGLLEPLGRCLTPASAREILSLHSDDQLRRRAEELADKSDEGQMTPEERAEYRLLVEVGDCVALLQARARQFLADHQEN